MERDVAGVLESGEAAGDLQCRCVICCRCCRTDELTSMCSERLVVRDQGNWTGLAMLSSQNVQGKALVFTSTMLRIRIAGQCRILTEETGLGC
jgi:hypothetical protein